MSTFTALIKREILDGKNGYIFVPVILTGITLVLVILSGLGFGSFTSVDGVQIGAMNNLGDVMKAVTEQQPGEISTGVTLFYWATTALTWVAFPFVIFFSLLGTLYEERRDRSILFWKSMPVADWQEVTAKFFTPLVITPLVFLGVVIAAQLFTALLLSMIVVFQGGPVLGLWPVGLMASSWLTFIAHYLLWMLWALPMLAWLLFVSSFAKRMPFLWAVLTPLVLIVVEGMFLKTHFTANWIGTHLGEWQNSAFSQMNNNIESPRDLMKVILGGAQWEGLTYSLASGQFWFGLVVAAGFVLGTIEMRKRAI